MAGDEVIGVTIDKAARIANVSVQRLAAWERVGLVRPRTRHHIGRRFVRVYGIAELVEACVVRELEDRYRLPIGHVHRMVEAVRSSDHPHPLSSLSWAVSSRELFVQYEDGSWVGGRRPDQTVMAGTLDLQRIRAAVRTQALQRHGTLGAFEQRDGVMGRKVVFAGTRTPLTAIEPYIRRGMADDAILEAFPHLGREDVAAARRQLTA